MARVIQSASNSSPARSVGSKSATQGSGKSPLGARPTAAKKPVSNKSIKGRLADGDVKLDLDPTAVKLTLQRISPLSAAKVGFFVSIALGIIMVVAVSIFWMLLDASGIFFQFSKAMVSSGLGVDVSGVFSVGKVAVVMAILAAVNVVLFTLASMIFAAIYNAAASLAGGLKMYFTRS